MVRFLWLVVLLGLTDSTFAQGARPPSVRYVRVELPGPGRVLSLADVQVFSAGENVAPAGTASQIATSNGAPAERANDGEVHGVFTAGSVTHTPEVEDAWWELDLGSAIAVEQISVWNRTDCCAERLDGFTLRLLGDTRREIWSLEGISQPSPRADFLPFGGDLLKGRMPSSTKTEMQPAINRAIDRGVAWLLDEQLRDGSWGHVAPTYRVGQTGLTVYTLAKSGLPAEHPVVQRGLEYLRANRPSKTYSMGCALLGLQAFGDPRDRGLMEAITEDLLSIQGAEASDGRTDELWAYTDSPSHLVDLSNTQYAALGLWAAKKAGVKVSKKAWLRAMNDTFRYQERPRKVSSAAYIGPRGKRGERTIAGFGYRIGSNPTGAMTVAGLTILAVCEDGVDGDLPRGLRREFDKRSEDALAWLGHNYSVDHNPGAGSAWHDYYLYGLERVGALFGLPIIGGREWYWEGARNLLQRQAGAGNWGDQPSTCFALLFLQRATAPVSGEDRKAALHAVDSPTSAVSFRATGVGQMTFWITGFSESALEAYSDQRAGGLRLQAVEYIVNGEVAGTLAGNTDHAWDGERFAWQHRLVGGQEHQIQVRVLVYTGGEVELGKATSELLSEPMIMLADRAADPALLRYAYQGATNLLQRTKVTIEASSFNVDSQQPKLAADGLHGTYWCAKFEDARPEITFQLARQQKGDTLLLSHVNLHAHGRDDHDKAKRVLVYINRAKDPLTLEMSSEDEVKSVLKLDSPTQLRRLRLVIVDREAGDAWPGFVGFSEVEWMLGD